MAGKVVLIRHGDTGLQYRGRYIGRTDVSLSPEGRLQSSLLAKPLRNEAAARYISSPSRRTCETARAALAGSTFVPELDPDLREIDFGIWEGKTFAEINASEPEAVTGWAVYKPDFAFPGGERIADFIKRVREAGRRIAADPNETVVVFTHGGVIRTLICHYLGIDSRNYLYFDVKPVSLTTLMIYNGKGILAGLNDLCHLKDGHNG